MKLRFAVLFLIGSALLASVPAQSQPGPAAASADTAWQQCTRLNDGPARLACFDRWAQQQSPPVPAASAALASNQPAAQAAPAAAEETTTAMLHPDCRSEKLSTLSRFWELEADSDCGRFNIRGYQPISLSWSLADSVNTEPSSPTAGHTANHTDYLPSEGRIQLSVRTKIGQGFLTRDEPVKRDSLWFAYSQQSYWQLFSSAISRPFRVTDHEPELIYIVPTDAELPGGWRLRYSGISFNHQSNGQPLPLSRSWNRVILMAGMEKDQRFNLSGRLWQRMPEEADSDDNPGISDYVGRAEIRGNWNVNKDNTLGLTVRHSLAATANGSYRLEWTQVLGGGNRGRYDSGLRFHTQLFSGYGDSLLDYNYHRTVLSIGLSLVDW